ncbi:class I SAM-dependent methyltransferase [Neisseria perflava]|uniref:class I SAM-dependent methyltransferase n=1 Tax=Neisseria perflava TaxID=33053 RepID=UPI0020A1845F|nr:methyltransferase domain-containing protein [Neisseria perflava]MCP1660630.1 SAM-dependent methyltransferase [Neisseria perflava]MCP1772370.1 SAM-dependent methyltransferase [Neisseria perflava]
MEEWFVQTAIGRYTAAQEEQFFTRYAPDRAGVVTAKMGGSWLRPSENVIGVPEDVRMEAEQMAWDTQSLDALILPHTHEYAGWPDGVLAEAARVLKPEGCLLLTGFNPVSLWHLSRWFDGKRLPEKGRCRSVSQIRKQAAGLGLQIEYGQFMAYVPPFDSAAAIRFWGFLEKAGDRWWPQCAAVYGLVLVKRMAGVHPLSEFETELEGQAVVLGMAKMQGK